MTARQVIQWSDGRLASPPALPKPRAKPRGKSKGPAVWLPGRGAQLSTSKLFLCRRLVLRNAWRCGRRCWLRFRLRRLHSRKHGCGPGSARRKNRKRDRRDHEYDRRPGRRPGKNRSRAPWAKRRLAALTAESCGQVAALSALQQHHRNQKQANDNVNHCDQNGHFEKNSVRAATRVKIPILPSAIRWSQYAGAEGGELS